MSYHSERAGSGSFSANAAKGVFHRMRDEPRSTHGAMGVTKVVNPATRVTVDVRQGKGKSK